MLCDTFHLVGFEVADKKKSGKEEESFHKKRLLGLIKRK
jgi:hypothetical protein